MSLAAAIPDAIVEPAVSETGVLSAEDVALGYARPGAGTHRILQDSSLELQQGEPVALPGPSGAGKSPRLRVLAAPGGGGKPSLLRVLAGLQRPRAGPIRLRGRHLTGPAPDVGFVFQDPCLLPWLTLEENVAFGLDFRHQPKLDEALRRQRVQQ